MQQAPTEINTISYRRGFFLLLWRYVLFYIHGYLSHHRRNQPYMITLHRSGQYRFYVNSGYNLEPPYICVKHEGHVAKFSLQPLALQSNNGFSRTELSRIQQAILDARDQLLKHWASVRGTEGEKPSGELLLHEQ